jgi:hypothetical protein
VAASLAHSLEAQPAQRLDCLLSRDDRETVRHAVSSTGAMIGDSMSIGRGWSSK